MSAYSRIRLMAATAVVGGACAAATLGGAVPAMAGTAITPVGTLTTWSVVPCDDLGEKVEVIVAGGLPSTRYTATAVQGGNGPVTFTTDVSGGGSGVLGNVNPDVGGFVGPATITVTAGGLSGTVTADITCTSAKGD
jgi:hypothetical protein